MARKVDSYRFLDPVTKRIVKAWIRREDARAIPWTPMRKPLREATVALVSSAGVALATDTPFDAEGERRNPWWGDPSFRAIPRDATTADVRIQHLHIDTAPAREDLGCVLPLERLCEMQERGEIGASAPSHYSIMGYILRPGELVGKTAPAIAGRMRRESVDAALLVPA